MHLTSSPTSRETSPSQSSPDLNTMQSLHPDEAACCKYYMSHIFPNWIMYLYQKWDQASCHCINVRNSFPSLFTPWLNMNQREQLCNSFVYSVRWQWQITLHTECKCICLKNGFLINCGMHQSWPRLPYKSRWKSGATTMHHDDQGKITSL